MAKFNLESFLNQEAAARKPCLLIATESLQGYAEQLRDRFTSISFESQQLDERKAEQLVDEVVEALEPKAVETGNPAVFLLDGKSLVEGDTSAVNTMLAMTKSALKDKTEVVAAFLPHPEGGDEELAIQSRIERVSEHLQSEGVTTLQGEAALEQWLGQF